jgi:hypothetical protein
MLISDRDTPRPWSFIKALRLRTWPRNATKEVTNDNSISFAKIVVKRIAFAGVNGPLLVILLPQKGSVNARPIKMPEKTQEKRHITMMLTLSHVKRDW